MAKKLVCVLVVSTVALLFAGCGGSGLSPAQQEVCDQLNARKKDLEKSLKELEGQRFKGTERDKINSYLSYNLTKRAEAGC
jgi:hypothetical protein